MMKKIKHLLNLVRVYFTYITRKRRCDYLPVRLWIETSSRCNLACRLCVNKDVPKHLKGDIDLSLYKKIIDEAKDFIFDVNLFHRGEPLLNKDIVEMVEYANDRGIKTRIHTNATLLDKDLSERLIKAGLSLISFSFDGYTKSTYEKNRVNATYEKTLENIKDFLKIKKELQSKTPFTILQVMEFDEELKKEDFSLQKDAFKADFEELGLDKLVIRTPHNWGGLLDLEGVKKVDKDKSSIIACTFPWYSLTVFYDGKVHLCPQDFEGEILLGDLTEDSIKEVFNGQRIRQVRDRFARKEIQGMHPCENCDRIHRETVMGIPKEYLRMFLKDSLRSR